MIFESLMQVADSARSFRNCLGHTARIRRHIGNRSLYMDFRLTRQRTTASLDYSLRCVGQASYRAPFFRHDAELAAVAVAEFAGDVGIERLCRMSRAKHGGLGSGCLICIPSNHRRVIAR